MGPQVRYHDLLFVITPLCIFSWLSLGLVCTAMFLAPFHWRFRWSKAIAIMCWFPKSSSFIYAGISPSNATSKITVRCIYMSLDTMPFLGIWECWLLFTSHICYEILEWTEKLHSAQNTGTFIYLEMYLLTNLHSYLVNFRKIDHLMVITLI